MVRTDPRKSGQLRGRLCHQPIQLLIEFGDFFGELLVAPCHRMQREFGRRVHLIRFGSGAKTTAGVDQILGRELAQTVTQLLRCGTQQSLQLFAACVRALTADLSVRIICA
jgi:hypothetical protein